MSDCFICVSTQALRLKGSPAFKSFCNVNHIVTTKLVGKASINPNKNQQSAIIKSKIVATGGIRENSKTNHNIKALDSASSKLSAWLQVRGVVNANIASKPSKLENKYVDKFSGYLTGIKSIKDFASVQKLYPISDKITSLNNSYFVNKDLSSGNLYNSIDEGLFTGNYNEHLNKSNRVADDNTSFIQPSSIFTSGTFRYKCEVSRPYHHPKNSFLFIRAAAPTSNYGANIPPEYRIHNIKLEDPSGNIIVQYKDITLKGDADYSNPVVNYATYISEPEINNANLHTWESNYPILSAASGYTLNLDFDIICLDDPFDQGFSQGYEERACELKFVNTGNSDYLALDGSPLSTHTQGYHLNPTNTIRISAIEICNSGDLCSSCSVSGIKLDNYFNFYTEIPSIGRRLSKTIYPVDVSLYNEDVGVYPEEYSLWESSPDYDLNVAYNTNASGSRTLISRIRNTSDVEYIKLKYNNISSDSGRLTLKFSHETPQSFPALRFGAFDFSSSTEFDRALATGVTPVDEFFTIDSLELKVVAKKAAGSRNYAFDVVGYSDDKILNITPKVGSFLQNAFLPSYLGDENDNFVVSELEEFIVDTNQTGTIPSVSGFRNIDDLGLSSETLSDKSAYYTEGLTSVDAGDHYLLSSLPAVDSEEFVEYTIPLSIYEDRVSVGKSIDYSMSSYFENLFIDLYPLPSGASISNIRLVVNYKPSNGMMLHTLGTPNNKKLERRNITLLPVGVTKNSDTSLNNQLVEVVYLVDELNNFVVSENNDYIVESGLILSKISHIPQSYGIQETLKTNYSRRWRGVDGNIVNGPYDPNQFDFSFYNPQSDHPFLNGYFDFNHVSGKYILSNDYANSGYYSGFDNILKNIGLRFSNNQLFNIATPYTTIDWTQAGDNIYGNILDAYDSAIRVSGQYGNINFGNKTLNNGFTFYVRFTPDQSIVGNGYNLFNSGVLASKWSSGNNLEFALSFKNGYLSLLARDITNNTIELTDTTPYYNYQYPLSVIATYIPGSPSGQLRLYCNDELSTESYLRDTNHINLNSGNSDFVVGYSSGSGIGINAFIHEIGFSTSGNLVHSLPNRLLKQTTVNSFLNGHSHTLLHNVTNSKFKLHDYINEDVSSWKLGDFKICSFSPDFDGFTTRIGKDYIVHHLKHNGSGYAQITNLPLPSSVNASGLAYHTQIENDFLRFNLQDMPDVNPEFYSTLPRICKTLPRDYDFAERAFAVDTIIEHETNNNILWPDGSIGPKLIVSLYSKNQEPVDRPSKVNWGLINRSIHYLKPSGCYEKLSSTFNYNDLVDISEPWALFDLDNVRSEFDQKYYSTDINDMFLQYDLVYPSGSPFESKIKIHSANVRLDNSLVYWADSSGQMNLYASGESISLSDINLYTAGLDYITNSGLVLYTSGSPWNSSSGIFNLCVSGVYGIPTNNFNLFVKNSGEISSLGPDLYVLGANPRDEQNINLVMIDNTIDQTKYESLDVYIKGQGVEEYNNTLPLFMIEPFSTVDRGSRSSMNLVTANDQILVYNSSNNINLYINTDIDYGEASGLFSLFVLNYPPRQSATRYPIISWNTKDLGSAIDPIVDSGVPFLNANDEIRGVELDCFGDCDNNNKCEEKTVTIHDLEYFGNESCIDGGIFRAKNTYTNLDVSGFKTDIGYSGHFYGIRKYDGLIPNTPYNVVLTNKTGNVNPIDLPSQFVELDYGSNQYVDYSGVKLAADKGLDETERQQGNKYGKSVAVKHDLIAVGAPLQTVSYQEYDGFGNLITTNLQEAGTVFLYRRDPRPSGYSWPQDQHKSNWLLEEKLTLPSGLLKDYATKVPTNRINGIPTPFTIFQNYWNVGGEGRNFGHSVSLGVNNNLASFKEEKREVLAVSGPVCKWSRDFEDLQTSGVSIGLLLFTDEFTPTVLPRFQRPKTYQNILNSIRDKDFIFTYFSDPPVKFDIKLIICEPLDPNTNTTPIDFPAPAPSFITKGVIPRNQGLNKNELGIFSGIKDLFDQAFPYDETKLHNNIPVMLGVYVDQSRSLGTQSVNPGLDKFLSYYQEYSFASGLKNFYDVPSSGSVYKLPEESNLAEDDWIGASQVLLDNLLDITRLNQTDEYLFFSSGVGPEYANTNLQQFNFPPPSGGRVYIFEKESGNWNLIQEIKSPVDSYSTYDYFGHSVSISEDTKILAVGSPYIDQCCKIYQYNPSSKSILLINLISWVVYKNSLLALEINPTQRYENLIDDYNDWVSEYGSNYANEILYSQLTPAERFEARQYLNIEEYVDIATYSYGEIPYKGKYWRFIPQNYAPSSRLGYSTAVNEDGSIVAFGAPTDSFNVFDDLNVWGGDYPGRGYEDPLDLDNVNGALQPSWRSNVNAGAVRLLEGRDYYPHNKVVEYGKFGNLQESLNNPLDSGHFDYIKNIFLNKPFVKMPEDEIDIPQDAGLAFIITPGVDALSDEVADSIVNWLALGDRNLVLVGNDPTWEENGLYKNSNDIINKLLSKLNSRMRIYPARNQEESLPVGSSIVLPSFIAPSVQPSLGISSYIQAYQLNTASGVGDIRMHFPNFKSRLTCYEEDPFNRMCQLPIAHEGDLRAQWFGACSVSRGGELVELPHPINWGYVFGTFSANAFGCELDPDEEEASSLKLPQREVVPILVAGLEKTISFTIPAIPEQYSYAQITEDRVISANDSRLTFVTEKLASQPSFIWNHEQSGYLTYNSNINDIPNNNQWVKPEPISNRNPILQSKASSIQSTSLGLKEVLPISAYCVEETLQNNSKIIAIAGVLTESETALYKSGFNDDNINFYANLVSKTKFGESRIAQLGGWTGVTSFVDGYEDSVLKEVFLNSFNGVEENVLIPNILHDVCWIANPKGLPSDQDLTYINAWLNYGNKKLIITHDSTQEQMLRAYRILTLLNSKIKPVYLAFNEIYPIVRTSSDINQPNAIINPDHPISKGFDINKYRISNFIIDLIKFVPFDISDVVPILYENKSIKDGALLNSTFMKLNTGIDKITFPSFAGSGYKIFIDFTSENVTENLPIDLYFDNISIDPTNNISLDLLIKDEAYPDKQYTISAGAQISLASVQRNAVNTISLNCRANSNNIGVYINSLVPRIENLDFLPKTVRLLAISGVPFPIEATQPGTIVVTEVVGFERFLVAPAVPERVVTQKVYGPVTSLNDNYCFGGPDGYSNDYCESLGWNNQLIADGPVVVAQEIEFITSFPAGKNRSRVTVISDSNLVQGRYMADEFGRISSATVNFITSLYPETPFVSSNFGKQYTEFTKLVSPERGSPQKLNALNTSLGLTKNFGNTSLTKSLYSFGSKESLYDPLFVVRPTGNPWPPGANDKLIKEMTEEELEDFRKEEISTFGGTPMFSGIINGKTYVDIGIGGGIPELMKDTGHDYLDFDHFYSSGYMGDLFGYSISLSNNVLIVGSPFVAFSDENINDWLTYAANQGSSGVAVSFNGGAGAAYVYKKTFNGIGTRNTVVPWEFIQKLRPQQINIAIENNEITDQFGYSVSIDSDVVAVGAPGHDFGNYVDNIYDSGTFIRKEFNAAFDIPDRVIVDLGDQNSRDIFGSGHVVVNNGAVFMFENSIGDWSSKEQKWSLVEKLVPDSGNRISNDYFGRSVSVHRSFRTDSDYVIVAGAENHPYSTSGTNLLEMAGAAFTHDIMLRETPPALPNPSSYIDVKVFGERGQGGDPTLRLITSNVPQNTTFSTSGIIYTNQLGAIFLEVSGQDPSDRGFIAHRPYVVSVEGKYVEGENNNNNIPLFIDGTSQMSQNMNIFAVGTTGNVYNNLGLYSSSIVDFGSGILNFYTDCPDPTVLASGLSIYVSGIGINSDQLNMRIRGY